MIKEIAVENLCLGMYITKVNCRWMKNPFWRKEFLLNSQRQLQLIQSSSAKSVWIDCDKGKSPENATECNTQAPNAIPLPIPEYSAHVQGSVNISLQEEMQRCIDPVNSCSGVNVEGNDDEHPDGRRHQALDSQA